MRFKVEPVDDQLQVAGVDSDGRPFLIMLDRVWAANLAIELEEWLAGKVDA